MVSEVKNDGREGWERDSAGKNSMKHDKGVICGCDVVGAANGYESGAPNSGHAWPCEGGARDHNQDCLASVSITFS